MSISSMVRHDGCLHVANYWSLGLTSDDPYCSIPCLIQDRHFLSILPGFLCAEVLKTWRWPSSTTSWQLKENRWVNECSAEWSSLCCMPTEIASELSCWDDGGSWEQPWESSWYSKPSLILVYAFYWRMLQLVRFRHSFSESVLTVMLFKHFKTVFFSSVCAFLLTDWSDLLQFGGGLPHVTGLPSSGNSLQASSVHQSKQQSCQREPRAIGAINTRKELNNRGAACWCVMQTKTSH